MLWCRHKSARDYLPALIESGHVQGVFDNSRSGALITWDYLHPDKPAPWLIQAISDRDLWQWKLDWSADALCALDNLEFDFCSWNALLQDGKAAAIRNGRLLRTDFERHLARIMDQGRDMQAQIAGFTVPALNAPHQFASHAGNLLCSGQSFALVWSDQRNGRRFSLRSTDAGEDVEIIAKRFGGGGHRNASGFVLPWHRVHEVRIEPKFVGLTPDGKYPSTCD